MKPNIEIQLEKHSDINKISESSTILVIIFWDMLMFYQIFLSPQLKRIVIIRNKHGIYELPNNLRLTILQN